MTLVSITLLYSGALSNQSLSTPMIMHFPVSLQTAAEPRPTGPATGMMMSAPSCIRDSANLRPSSVESKLPVNSPSSLAVSQPSSLTLALFCWL